MLGKIVIHDGRICVVGNNTTRIYADEIQITTEKYPYMLYDCITHEPIYTATEEYIDSCQLVGNTNLKLCSIDDYERLELENKKLNQKLDWADKQLGRLIDKINQKECIIDGLQELLKKNSNNTAYKEEYITLQKIALDLLKKYRHQSIITIAELSTNKSLAHEALQFEYECYLSKINNKYLKRE